MATKKPDFKPFESKSDAKKSTGWRQGINNPKTNWASKKAVNRPTTNRSKQNKMG